MVLDDGQPQACRHAPAAGMHAAISAKHSAQGNAAEAHRHVPCLVGITTPVPLTSSGAVHMWA
jgi:hypothetical protein